MWWQEKAGGEREVREVKDKEEGTSAVLLHSQRLTN